MNVAVALCPVWQYDIISEMLFRPELGEYHAYGVKIATPGYADVIHDVSVCKETAERIVERLNLYQVSPVHLYDVVLDLLS